MEKNKASWFKKRGYLHLDRPIIDSKDLSWFENQDQKDLISKHAFLPFLKYKIETPRYNKSPKERSVSYASHADSHIYSYYAHTLGQLYEQKIKEAGLTESVVAFRKLGTHSGKCNIDIAYDAFNTIKQMSECSVLALDLSKFFDTLDHQILIQTWSKLLGLTKLPKDHYKVYKSLTQYCMIDRDQLYKALKISKYNPRAKYRKALFDNFHKFRRFRKGHKALFEKNTSKKGIPQGSPISALLSNIYMLSFDECMHGFATNFSGKYYRYCDDILLIVPNSCMDVAEHLAKAQLESLKVTLNEQKTEKRFFKTENSKLISKDEFGENKSLQYLGFLFNGQNCYLRSSSLSRYSKKMKGGVKLAKKTMAKANKKRENNHEKAQNKLYRKKLHRLYSFRGKRNFISYGYKAARIMDSQTIRKQLKPLWKRLENEINKDSL